MAIRETVSRVFTPQNTKVWHKLALVAATLVIPITALNWLLLSSYRDRVDSAKREVDGTSYLVPVRQLTEHVIQHRGLSSSLLNGDASARKDMLAKQSEIEADLRAVGQVDATLGDSLHVREKWAAIRDLWPDVRKKSTTAGPQQNLEQHNQLVKELLGLITALGDTSNLRFDPEAVGSFLVDTMTTQVPAEANVLGQIRDVAVASALEKKLSPENRTALAGLVGQAEPYSSAIEANTKALAAAYPLLGSQLNSATSAHSSSASELIDLVKTKILQAGGDDVSVPAQDVFDAGRQAISSGFQLYDASAPTLGDLLQHRIKGAQSSILFAVLVSLAGILLTLLVGVRLSRSITDQVENINELFGQIGIGNYDARAEVTSTDELGTMAYSLNTMLDNTLVLVQSREDRDAIQNSIVKLLEEVSGVAEGDLTREAEVTEDVTGAIADSFNYMINQLRRIISDVQDATLQVGTSANDIHATTDRLVQGAEGQADQIINTSSAIEEIALSIQQVSANATDSAHVAQQARLNAAQGSEAVQNTIQGMNRIRDQAQETAKRIKRLGESSQEIGQIIQLIDDIADRTSILALNASIQAAAAGEAGRGFAVVAEEVERLAERSTDATKKIATLIKTIQSETNEAVGSMEKSIHEVVEGSKLANQAGHALEEIESVSSRLAELIQSISQASKQQAQGSEAVSKAMANISHITQETAGGTRQASELVGVLAGLAETLRNSVSTFRLPEREWSAESPPLPSAFNGHGPSEAPSTHHVEKNGNRSGEFRRVPVHA